MYQLLRKLILLAVVLLPGISLFAQEEANYDESKIPPYTLPELLTLENGRKVTSAAQWMTKRRPEIFSLYEDHIFGKSPKGRRHLHFRQLTEDKSALNGTATRKEIAVYLTKDKSRYITVLMYLPNNQNRPAPVFFGMNFQGNHTISEDTGITLTETSLKQGDRMPKRGAASARWPVEFLIQNGYGLVTVHNSDIEPDVDKGSQGTIAAWSFALSCIMDYLGTDKDIDSKSVVLFGHSRNGKAALWAGAMDERFAVIISNDSGCGGAALFRRRIGETVKAVNTTFPHWFCENFKQYNDKEDQLPVDQHQLIALMAPRPVYIASAVEDRWADPKGEFLSGVHASPVYELFGLKGLTTSEMPALSSPVMDGYIAYHIRPGVHNITLYDWQQFVKFADKHLKK